MHSFIYSIASPSHHRSVKAQKTPAGGLECCSAVPHGVGETVPHPVIELEARAGGFDLPLAQGLLGMPLDLQASSFIQDSERGGAPWWETLK